MHILQQWRSSKKNIEKHVRYLKIFISKNALTIAYGTRTQKSWCFIKDNIMKFWIIALLLCTIGMFAACEQQMPAPRQRIAQQEIQQLNQEAEQKQIDHQISRDEYSAYATSLNFCITCLQTNMKQELLRESENGRRIAIDAANRQGITPAQWIENAPTEVKAARLRLLNLMGYPTDPNN
jgi:hypothetical protein